MSKSEEVKNLERQLRHCQEAVAHRNEHLEFMARMFSHNLRSPVAGMNMLLQLMERVEEEDRQEVMENFKDASELLFRMINDLAEVLMDYRLLTEEKQEVDVEQVITGVKSDLDSMIEKSSAEVYTDLEIPLVHYYLPYMRIIITELMSNALIHASEDRQPKVLIRTYREGDKVMLSVTDNGQGIDINQFSKDLFKMYKSLQVKDMKDPAKGRGLFRVKNIVEINGGHVEVKSTPGKGSTFYMELYRD